MTLYTKDVHDMDDLTDWMEQENEDDTLCEPFDFNYSEYQGRLHVRFVEGDALNAPARLCDAVAGTGLVFDHLSVEGTATAIIKDPDA